MLLHHRGQDFNCTIQELKLEGGAPLPAPVGDFNCTIQELKLQQLCI